MSFQITVKSCVPLGNYKASNLYCTIRIGDSALKTGVYKGKNHTAVWNHTFNVNCKQSFLKIELWQDGFFQDTILADYMLNLSKYYSTPGIKHCQVITLSKPSKNVGQVTLEIKYNREETQPQPQAPKKSVSKEKPSKKAVRQAEELKKPTQPTEYAKEAPKEYAKQPAKQPRQEKPTKPTQNLYDKPVPFAGTILGVGSISPNYAPTQNIPFGQQNHKVPPSFRNEPPAMNITVPPNYRQARQPDPSPDKKDKTKQQKTMKVAQTPQATNKQSQQVVQHNQQQQYQKQQQQLKQKYQAQQQLQMQQMQAQQVQQMQQMQYQQMYQPQFMGIPIPPIDINMGNLNLLLGGNTMPHIPGLSFLSQPMGMPDYGGWSGGWF